MAFKIEERFRCKCQECFSCNDGVKKESEYNRIVFQKKKGLRSSWNKFNENKKIVNNLITFFCKEKPNFCLRIPWKHLWVITCAVTLLKFTNILAISLRTALLQIVECVFHVWKISGTCDIIMYTFHCKKICCKKITKVTVLYTV